MSFGVSVGDILAIGALCGQVYTAIKDGPRELAEARSQLASLETALSTLRTVFDQLEVVAKESEGESTTRIKQGEKADLETLVKGCDETLKDFQKLVHKYAAVTTSKRLSCGNLKFSLKDGPALANIRSRITVHTNGINMLLQSFEMYVPRDL
jgi:chromosome segregation ATPase